MQSCHSAIQIYNSRVKHIAPKEAAELDATETREWLDSLEYVLQSGGPAKVARLLRELTIHARQNGVKLPFTANTPYINTIPADEEPPYPGDRELERRIKSHIRWNAMAMVVNANRVQSGIGGHISTSKGSKSKGSSKVKGVKVKGVSR